ncbi:TonB-dependent receptor plug domain-containing protein [Teredinibacter haidensis]|uniref:TonB-dependent receptor plug domain-containing protein n=1 Tax=Teredinibacter haidensis TaxID=2731755 RepID=UPI000948EF38|nr:TonB-dependent receptor [Teredinibacter haidensis]
MKFNKLLLSSVIAGMTTASMGSVAAEDGNERLEVMVVTASMTEKTTQTAPAFTSVITAEDITATPINGLPELLKETVGVNNFTDASGRDQLQLRGLGGNYTLVLVNGKRVSSSSALWRGGDFDLNSIPLNSIKQVEVVRGPMSSLYGADAIGGVINVITKAPVDEWQGVISGEYQSVMSGDGGNQVRAGVSSQGGLTDTLHLSVSAEAYDRDAWYSDDSEISAPKLEKKKAQNLFTTLRWQLAENQSLDFDLGYNKDDRPHSIYYASGDLVDYREQEISRSTLGVTHMGDWGWGNSTVQLQQEDGTIDDFNSRYDAPAQRELNEKNTYLKGYLNTKLGNSNYITAGLDYREQIVSDNVSYQDTGEVSITDSAVFAQDEISIGDSFTLTLGGRMDDNEFFGSHFTPRAYVVYQLNDAITLKGGVSEAFKAPQAYQLSEEYRIISCGGSCFLSGNPDLDPETSTNVEFGIAVSQSDWNLTAVIFQNEVTDMISATYDAEANQRNWENIDKVETSGLELEGTYSVNDKLQLSGNYTKLETEDSAGEKLENRPEQIAHLKLDWQALDAVKASLSINYTGEQVTYVWPDYLTLPSYTRADLGFSSVLSESFTLRYGIKNLTDVKLHEEDDNFDTYELGRNVYLSASYTF